MCYTWWVGTSARVQGPLMRMRNLPPLTPRQVAVTGLGVVSPSGFSVEEVWNNALAGVRPFHLLTQFPTEGLLNQVVADIPESWEKRLPSSVRFRYDRHAWFALDAASQALKDSGLDMDRMDPTRAGVVMGTAHGPVAALEAQWLELAHLPLTEWTEMMGAYLMPHSSLNTACAATAIIHNLQGPSIGIATACAAGASALGEAADAIRLGRAEVMVAGAAEAAITRTAFYGYAKIGAMSRRNHDPEGALRPFDRDRDGFVMGEGAAVFVLEELEHARARGAKIYAMLTGYGAASDSHHLTNMHPDGRGVQAGLRGALRDAGLETTDIDLVNAHGSSTRVNDLIESRALRAVMGAHRPLVQSTKSLTGHLMGAAGAIEALFTVLQIHRGVVLPTANCEHQDPECDVDVLTGDPREMRIRAALTSSAGFGGPDATIAFEEA